MIQVNEYDIDPPPESITTEQVPKPEPDTDPVPIWESTTLLDTCGHGKDRIVLFSGGDDSLALTHFAFQNDLADIVLYLDTGSAIPKNIDYVRNVCEEMKWPLIIISSPMTLETFALRYGFAGNSSHQMAYNYFKGRQLQTFANHREGDVKFLSGVRKAESERRMENITAEVQYEDASEGGNFTGWWISPLMDKSDSWIHEYQKKHDLPRNPVAEKIHRSGDCQCLAFGSRGTELTLIEAEYPKFGRWLRNVETRVQEYRGRVNLFEERYPTIYEDVDDRRKNERPNPMRLTILKEHYPDVFHDIVAVDTNTAIAKGRTDHTNYIGHGGLSSRELRTLVSQADSSQQTLCETCSGTSDSIVPSVKRQQDKALSHTEQELIQTTLSESKA